MAVIEGIADPREGSRRMCAVSDSVLLRPGVRSSISEVRRPDRQVLTAVVGNLLQNGFKFTRPRTTVALRVDASAERVRIEIQDECGGLPTETAHEQFRPFDQHGADRTGLGLGLAFCRSGVEANDGRLYTRNVPDSGCVFIVDLPRVAVQAAAIA